MADRGHRHHGDHRGHDNDHRRHDNNHRRHDNDHRRHDRHERPPVIVQQPQQFQNVVVQYPTAYQSREWSSGLCGCFKDIPLMLCVASCGECYICKVSNDMGEGCCMACCCPGRYTLALLRVKLRTQHNIQGSICHDLCVSCCCWSCSLCQLQRELNYIRRT